MGGLFRALMNLPLFRSILRPVTRVIVGIIAIPVFRFVMRRVFRLHDLDDELEKDLEEWFRGALLLLAASANMEHLLFGWMEHVNWLDRMDWLTMGLRLMLAISVIEAMPDQELFAVIHPGPPKIRPGRRFLSEFWARKRAFIKGFICQHINRSSPVLAMMTAIVGAQLPALVDARDGLVRHADIMTWSVTAPVASMTPASTVMAAELMAGSAPEMQQMQQEFQREWERWIVGWVCYLLAVTQYLIIGLVTSRDRAMDVLSEFDRAVARRRRELIEEFHLTDAPPAASSAPPSPVVSESPAEGPGRQEPSRPAESGPEPPPD